MTRKLSRWQALLLGGLVLGGFLLGIWGLFQIGDRHRLWSERITLTVGFDRVQGVNLGTPVRVRGLEAGVVAAIDLPSLERPEAPLTLHLQIDRKFQPYLFADASARILQEGMIGARVIEIDPGQPSQGPLNAEGRLASRSVADLADLLAQSQSILTDLRQGRGTLGKLLTDDSAYNEAVSTLQESRKLMQRGQDTARSLQQDADALKKMPLIRGYVEDKLDLLTRPTHARHRQFLPSEQLFLQNRAILSDSGRSRLNELGHWLNTLGSKGSDIVIAAFADPQAESSNQVAQTLTQKQSEVVARYLKDNHRVHKLSWLRWRDVTPIGLGIDSPLPPEPNLPPARVEVMVFVPAA